MQANILQFDTPSIHREGLKGHAAYQINEKEV